MAVRPCEVPAMLATQLTLDDLTSEWRERLDSFPADVRERVAQTAERHRTDLASHFYGVMLAHKEAAQFLSHGRSRRGSVDPWKTGSPASTTAAKPPISSRSSPTRPGSARSTPGFPFRCIWCCVAPGCSSSG